MRNALVLFGVLLFLTSCTNNTNTKPTDPTEENPQTAPTHFSLKPISQAIFDQQHGDSLQKLLIEQFCEESKGYQKDVWLGLNKCSWAIEKYRLDQNPEIVQRYGDELSVVLSNGEKKSFIHQRSKPNSSVFFQFRKMLPQSNQVLIEKITPDECPKYILIHLADGKETALSGQPFFSKDQHFFLLNGSLETCGTSLEKWEISPKGIHQVWSEKTQNLNIVDFKWIDEKQFLIKTKDQDKLQFYQGSL